MNPVPQGLAPWAGEPHWLLQTETSWRAEATG
jgi:hypothetical protein